MLKVKLLDPAAKVPTRANKDDAGLDLYAMTDYLIPAYGGRLIVKTGIAVAIPAGHAGMIRPRSGLAIKSGIDVLAGVVDAAYRGEIGVVLINHGDKPFVINAFDRVAQLVVQPIELWEPVVVDELDSTERGAGGFGSSGN